MKKTNTKLAFGILAIFALTILFLSCSDENQDEEQPIIITEQQNTVNVSFTVMDSISRTVLPQVSLANVALYKLMGGMNDDVEIELIEFTTGTASVSLTPGTWNFTLNAYDSSNAHLLQGRVQNQEINQTGNNNVSFSLAVINSGTGNIQVTLNFPNEAGITQIKTTGDITAETFSTISNGNFIYTKNDAISGNYFINFELYRENVLRAVVSELVLVRNNLTSSKTITLVGDDLKPLLTGTVRITGNALVDGILTADTSNLNGIGTISYQWKRGTTDIGTNSSTYTVLATDVGGAITVTVTREGYVNSVTSSATASVPALVNVTFSSLTQNGSSTQLTSQLTLSFSQAITDISANDITLSGVTGVQKGILSCSGSTYTLPISGFTSGGTLTVAITKAGYNINSASRTIAIYGAPTVTFNIISQNGSTSQATTQLTLAFGQAITGLTASDITLSGVSGVTKGTLSGSGPTYTLAITTTSSGTLTVAVAKSGFNFNPTSITVLIFGTPITFNDLTQNGSSAQITSQLTLIFSQTITGLAASDITLSGVSGVTRGTLNGSGGTYTLTISGHTSSGTLTVAVAKSGFNISPTPRTIPIFGRPSVDFKSVTANGSSSQTTTQLTLNFSQAIAGLTASDITLSGVSGVSKGTLSGSGPTYTLAINVFRGGSLTVAVAKTDFTITSPASRTVTVYGTGWDGSADDSWYYANPTATQFTITTATQLAGLARLVNGGNTMSGRTITLGSNIVLNNTANWQNWATSAPDTANSWTPIGDNSTTSSQFAGTFDGNGYVVSGIYINRTGTTTINSYQGLFGYISSGGTIKNIGITESYVRGYDYVGGLVGYFYSNTITNSYTTGNVSGRNYIGGMVGYNYSNGIRNSYATGSVTGTGSNIGGLVGGNDNYASLDNIKMSYYNSTTSGTGSSGTSKTAAEMQSQGFTDLLNVGALRYATTKWVYSEGGYPTLSRTLETMVSFFASGSGTSTSPYIITTKKHLESLAAINYYSINLNGVYFKLNNDIVLDNAAGFQNWANNNPSNSWTPIGDSSNYFNGAFNGGGFVISGVFINSTSSYRGLFGYIGSSGAISNLGVVANITGSEYIGGLTGYNSGAISNCYAAGSVTATSSSSYIGGLAGYNNGYIGNGTITNCYATTNVTGRSFTGGLAGYNYRYQSGTITNCYAVGTINVPLGSSYVGGLVGYEQLYNNSYTTGISSSYYNRETSERTDEGKGIPKSTSEMKLQSTYTGWNFTTSGAWNIGSLNNGYPYLRAVTPTSGGGTTTPPSTTITTLSANTWANGTLSATTTEFWYSFSVNNGTTYRIW